jgi:hypothetical protein
MNRWLRTLLIGGVAFAFTILAARSEPRHPNFSHSVTGMGIWIVLAIYTVLRLDFLGHSAIRNYLILAIDTLIYSGLIVLLLKLCKRRAERHHKQP